MDEFSVILRARELIREADINFVPVEIEKYLKLPRINAVVRPDDDLPNDQAGSSTTISGRHVIFVNARHSPKRQRFTVLHELGHIFLQIPSLHSDQTRTRDLFSYRGRPINEVLCDVFAAELLLPEPVFRKDVNRAEMGFSSIENLAAQYEASLTSTGSRFAVLNEEPCAFILSEAGKVRYVSYSVSMRQQRAWISPRLSIPADTLTTRWLQGARDEGPIEIAAYNWLENEKRKDRWLFEDVRLLEQWNQALTLLWLEESDYCGTEGCTEEGEEEETGLRELDGLLPWPSKRKRR